uniref:hypothetical protein n=1 Tax=Tessaracoccus bendigoensis TaxID=72764 RepID=UPI001FE9FCF0|nr:hypothetical protein [Tessaracoccus bendigoensis]
MAARAWGRWGRDPSDPEGFPRGRAALGYRQGKIGGICNILVEEGLIQAGYPQRPVRDPYRALHEPMQALPPQHAGCLSGLRECTGSSRGNPADHAHVATPWIVLFTPGALIC